MVFLDILFDNMQRYKRDQRVSTFLQPGHLSKCLVYKSGDESLKSPGFVICDGGVEGGP